MKKTFILLLLICLYNTGKAQMIDSNITKQNQIKYLKKSHSSLSTGFVALGAGLALTIASNATRTSGISAPTGFIGLFCILGSVPFFVSAGNYKSKARLAIRDEVFLNNGLFAMGYSIPSILLCFSLK